MTANEPLKPPEIAWLQWLDDDGEVAEEVTWCEDMILDTDVKYIRADLVDALRAEVARLSSDQDAAWRIAADYHRYDMTKEYVASKKVIDEMQDENERLRAELERALKTMADATAALEKWTAEWKRWQDNPEDDALVGEITTPAVWTGKHDPNVIVRAEPKGD